MITELFVTCEWLTFCGALIGAAVQARHERQSAVALASRNGENAEHARHGHSARKLLLERQAVSLSTPMQPRTKT